MKSLVALIGLTTFSVASASACDLTFRIEGQVTKYTFHQIGAMIDDAIRANVTPTKDDNDRYKLVISNECDGQPAPPADTATFSIQHNTIYLEEINDLPLCDQQVLHKPGHPDRLVCAAGGYNFVDYQHQSLQMPINEASAVDALKVLANLRSVTDLSGADQATGKRIHDAVKLYAMVIAEAARFDYVANDLQCAATSGGSIQFADYWTLIHNWGTSSAFVQSSRPDLEGASTKRGVGDLIVPITREMVQAFDAELTAHPRPNETTPDGKNTVIPLRTPTCDLTKIVH